MNNLQFTLEDSPLLSIQSPGIVDISSDSGEEFVVHPNDLSDVEERFRVGGPISDMLTAFVGATSATLFTPGPEDPAIVETIDTAGTQIEQQMMEIIEEHQFSRGSSSTSFIDTKLEDSPMSPWESAEPSTRPVKSYGRPAAAILPTPRSNNHETTVVNRPIPTHPPNFANTYPIYQPQQITDPKHQQADHPVNGIQPRTLGNSGAFSANPNGLPIYGNAPIMIQIPPHEGSAHVSQLITGTNAGPSPHFPFQAGHSTNLLLLPFQERLQYRLLPPVMPNVAGFCDWCGKCYDLIALETLGEYLIATAYDGETVRDRGVRSRAFIDGFEAALFSFKGAGLSQPHGCSGSVLQE